MRRYTIEVNGRTYMLDVRELSSDSFEVTCDDQQFDVLLVDNSDLPEAEITPVMATALGDHVAPPRPAKTAAPKVVPKPPKAVSSNGGGKAGTLTAPMPGVILSVDVKPGARVSRGDVLIKLEAMKMVNPIRATKDAVIAEVLVSDGQTVAYGDKLLTFAE